jgi:hypothetical protein
MDYIDWAEEYKNDAKKIKKIIDKYRNILKEGKSKNEENINSVISSYEYIYYDLINTAKKLERRVKG